MTGLVLTIGSAQAETIRIGAWNIQDLHHEEGVHLRAFNSGRSVERTAADFALLIEYRDKFGRDAKSADVIALQEIGTKAALDRLFPSAEYHTIMSPRWENDDAPEGKGDVYTAIAVRKASGVTVIDEDPLLALSVLHSDGRPTRAGTGALLEANGQQFWFLSVHLKSSCSTTKNAHVSTADDCRTLWKQMPALKNWIDAKSATGLPYIVAGDFNRRFRQFNDEGSVWELMNGIDPANAEDTEVSPRLVKHPLTVTRRCPTRKGTSPEPIDWIVLDVSLAEKYVEGSFWERRFSYKDINAAQRGKGLSDHCPISIDLVLP